MHFIKQYAIRALTYSIALHFISFCCAVYVCRRRTAIAYCAKIIRLRASHGFAFIFGFERSSEYIFFSGVQSLRFSLSLSLLICSSLVAVQSICAATRSPCLQACTERKRERRREIGERWCWASECIVTFLTLCVCLAAHATYLSLSLCCRCPHSARLALDWSVRRLTFKKFCLII